MSKEPVEVQLDKYIQEHYKNTKEELSMMNIGYKLLLVNMKNVNMWEEFKIGFRKSGYII